MRACHSYQIMGLYLSSEGLDDQDYWGLLQPKAQDKMALGRFLQIIRKGMHSNLLAVLASDLNFL